MRDSDMAWWNLVFSKMAGPKLDPEIGRHVYCVKNTVTGLLKIGYAKNVKARIGQLSSQSGCRMRLLGVVPGGPKKESEVHSLFASQRRTGEWFSPSPEIADYFAAKEQPCVEMIGAKLDAAPHLVPVPTP